MIRPAGLTYWVDERPPNATLGLLAIQHIFLMSSTLVLPIVLVNEIGGDFREVAAVVALTMISCGIGTILQALRLPGLGSGFLCPNLCGPNFFAASMSAAWLGGLPLMRGMTILAGLVELVFSRFFKRIAFLFPTEITGLVVFMVALSLIPLGASKFLFVQFTGDSIRGSSLLVAAVTLIVMVGLNVWGGAKVRLYAVLIGMLVGYALSGIFGLFPDGAAADLAKMPWVGLPWLNGMLHVTFNWSLLPVFAIVSICGALKSYGNLVMAEKVNDAGWSEPDNGLIANGLAADAACVTISGLLGGVASDTSASNVALSAASGATSRWIAYAAGGLFMLLGLSPKVGALLSIMPSPVEGAIVVFVTCFMMVSGFQIMLSAKPDMRKTFVIGIALCFGLSLDILPQLYGSVPGPIRPLFDSSLTLATVIAVVLNQLLHLGPKVESAPPPAEA